MRRRDHAAKLYDAARTLEIRDALRDASKLRPEPGEQIVVRFMGVAPDLHFDSPAEVRHALRIHEKSET